MAALDRSLLDPSPRPSSPGQDQDPARAGREPLRPLAAPRHRAPGARGRRRNGRSRVTVALVLLALLSTPADTARRAVQEGPAPAPLPHAPGVEEEVSTTDVPVFDQLVWADEFDGESGAPPSAEFWTHDLGTTHDGWGNEELQYYTDSPRNVSLDGRGNLRIVALHQFTADGSRIFRFTSGRITTRDRISMTHGRLEARIRLPFTTGTWPALWLLGEDCRAIGWPRCGEIDVMEASDDELAVRSNVHGPRHGSQHSWQSQRRTPLDSASARDWHVYGVSWNADQVAFFVDGRLVNRVQQSELGLAEQWVFDRPFNVVLNMAVGGDQAEEPISSTAPATMEVDYVRFHQ